MRTGCLRPLLLSMGLLLLFGVVLVVVYFDTFRLMGQNMTAMGEGKDLAEVMRSPDDLLAYIAEHPENTSLVAYDLGREERGIFYGADARRPVVGVTRLLVLLEWARQVEQGLVEVDSRVPLDSIERYVLPISDQSGFERLLQHFANQNVLADDSTVSLDDMVGAMMQGHAATADWIIDHLGRDAVGQLPERLDLSLDMPLPGSGLFLSWSNHTLTSKPEERLAAIRALAPTVYADSVYHLAATYRQDSTFRSKERARLAERGTDLNLRQQRELAQATFPRGTAQEYAQLLARALTDSLLTPAISQRLIKEIERPLVDSAQVVFQRIGSQAGSFPGMISFVGFARRPGSSQTRIVVLLMDDLPIAVFYHLMQTGIDKGFEVQLLGDDAFFEHTRQMLTESGRGVGLSDGTAVVTR